MTPSIDLRSDTVTRPTAAMRQAMASAEVGDDVLDGDPTTKRLEARVAELLGKERALFFPTGTMANQAGVWLLAERGTEVLLDANAHLIHYEFAGIATLVGCQIKPVAPSGLTMSAADLAAAFRAPSVHVPKPSLVCVENTHNGAGGKVTPLEELRAIRDVATRRGLPVHMDGARLWNASASSGASLAELAACADTVMVAFSKGLGAPIGAALVGDAAVMADAWSVRKRLGGGMRQSGVLAAAALHGLDHHLDRLPEDHAHARTFASLVDGAGGARVVPPDTNIVMVDLPDTIDAFALVQRAAEQGVKLTPWHRRRFRAVTHLDVTEAQMRVAGEQVARLLGEFALGH